MSNTKNKDKSKKNKTVEKKSYNLNGLLQVFVVASIAYTTAIILMGTDGYINYIMTAPQAIYAGWLIITKFLK